MRRRMRSQRMRPFWLRRDIVRCQSRPTWNRKIHSACVFVVALIHSPDRLSRKYAYQVLLSEELSRCGVDVIYLKSPSGDSPEDQLVVQFQGMIAEYERAQIAERHRRGKRHRAQQGMVNALSGAPHGYRY